MAGQITHILVGEAALLAAAPRLGPELLSAAGREFRLGCQGPDIFYHNQRTKPSGLHYGALAHRRDYGRIIEGALASLPRDGLRATRPDAAYLLGLATHAAVDRRTHPFIVFYSGWADPGRPGTERFRSCHPFFERILDIALLSRRRGLEPRGFDMEELMAPAPIGTTAGVAGAAAAAPSPAADPGAGGAQRPDAALVSLWAAGLRRAFPRSAGGDFLLERRVANALDDAGYFIRITNPARTAMSPGRGDWFAYLDDRAGPRSVALVYPDRLPAGLDFGKLGSEGWEHPAGDGRVSSATYFELVAEAEVEARVVLERLLPLVEAGGEDPGLADGVGNGGLSVNDLEGQPVPPRVSRPLPLPELMAAEFDRRLAWARQSAARH